jgi:hypothetical protein
MGRGYINVRATEGAVKPLPWRGQRGLGCRSKPLLKDKKGLGMLVTCRVKPCKKRYGGYPPARWNLAREFARIKKSRRKNNLAPAFLGGLGEISISSRPLESLDKGRLSLGFAAWLVQECRD